MRFTRHFPTGQTVQAGATLVDAFAGARVGGALLPSLGAVSAGGPLVLTGGPRRIGGHGLLAWEGAGSSMVHAKMRRPLVLGTDQWLSFVVVFRKRASSIDANVIAAFGSDSGTSGNTLMYLAGDASGANIIRFYIQDSGGATYTSPNPAILTVGNVAVSDMRWHTIALCTSLVDLGGGGTSLRRAYIDGMFEGEGTAAPATLAATTFQHMCANGIVRTTVSASAGAFDVALVVPLFGRLDHAELRSLSLNPWQLFTTQKHRPVLRQEAGGSGTTDYVGSGGIVFGGAATTQRVSHTNTYVGSGGITFGGSAGVTTTDVDPGGPVGGELIVENGMWVGSPNGERVCFYNGAYYGGGIASGSGDLIMWKYTPAIGDTQRVVVQAAFQYDDHVNPAIFILPSGRIAIAYCKHTTARPQVQVSTNPEDITSWGPVVYSYWTNAAYSAIFQLGSYYFVAFQPTSGRQDAAARTTDFTSFGTAFLWLYTPDVNTYTPYFTLCQNGPNRIDVVYVTGHPGQGDLHPDLYHVYYTESGGAMIPHKSDGTLLTMPVLTTTGTLIYDSGVNNTNLVMCHIRIGQDGHPRVLFVRFETINDHRCMFARWTGSAWTTAVEIVGMGQGIAPGFEPYYSGLMCFDGNDTNRVYVSVKVGSFQEIQQWETTDNGATWGKTADITTASAVKNFRPFSPPGHDGIKVFWLAGTYTDYTDFYTDIWAHGATAGTSLQYARPNADVSDGAWTSTAADPAVLYTEIDETAENDAEYITCDVVGSACRMRLSTITDPLTGNGHVIRYRARAPYGGRVAVNLFDTSSSRGLVASWITTLTPLFTTYSHTLTTDEANLIVNYATLELGFNAIAVAPFGE